MTKFKIKLDRERKARLERIISDKDFRSSTRAKKKATVVLLRSSGKSIKEIMNKTKLSKGTIITYIKIYLKDDMYGIHGKTIYKHSAFENVHSDLIKEFEKNPPYSYKEARDRIKRLYNITKSESATRRYLIKNGIYTPRKRKKMKKKNDRN